MELKPHEIRVIEMLVSDVISSETLNIIKRNPNITDYNVTGHGYFLTIVNTDLPIERIVCHTPMIIGECNGVESTFLIFIEEHELTIECAGMSEIEPPEDYRDWDINVRKA
ncbi:MAG: hypothetical protein QM500_04200 [Methylococcales bacterium]